MQDLLPVYQGLTCSVVSNGVDTSFWHDRWLSAGRLSDVFPLLLSHAANKIVTVAQVVMGGLDSHLTARLSPRQLQSSSRNLCQAQDCSRLNPFQFC
uniref:Reverse transcriptase zinc-binding domain-containing protein n=1 Tax=Setaria viridis TaxID=4556 RepID=A0A4U6TBK7_SETVI|nr:hypothetical protein SEVIR_8G043300v2 [Setaria viridis]